MKINVTKSLFLIFIFSFLSFYSYSQSSFRYQAVARDSSGAAIANQMIGIQISIIQVETSLPPIYEEMHQVMSNAYGVINLNIGDGIPLLGEFDNIDWSLKSFAKIDMDITGGTNYDLSSLSEILAVPVALYAKRAGSIEGNHFGLNVKSFGAKGDGSTDDTDAFEMALDSAKIVGSKVFIPQGIYKITRSLNVEAGVSLIGEGSGSTPLETPHNGSLIWYDGNDFAVKVTGSNARVKDIVIRDKSDENALGGVLLQADGNLLESVVIDAVLISGFTAGTGLKLDARNAAGIAYASFNNVRVRHGKIGMHITETDDSFLNSNAWENCQISGGGFDFGMLVEGGNNNFFSNHVIEPPSSTQGHLVVNKGEISGTEMRIEGFDQDDLTPLVFFNENTRNSIVTGTYGGGLTLDKGNNFINMKSGKAIHFKNSNTNKFKNSTFFSPNNSSVKDWKITGAGISTEVLSPELTSTHNVLKLVIPAGVIARFEPDNFARPQVKELSIYDQVNFGFHIKINHPGIAYTATNAPAGWTNSTAHSGSGEWEFVGMNSYVNRNAPSRFIAQINNTTGSQIEVFITTPTLSFGNQLPTLDEAPLTTSGGRMNGMLSYAMAEVNTPPNGFLTLPLKANYFEITNTNNIHRINYLAAHRAPKGTVITLLFNKAGVGVTKSGYLLLKSGYNSVANGSITLISNGNGTWREVDRNN